MSGAGGKGAAHNELALHMLDYIFKVGDRLPTMVIVHGENNALILSAGFCLLKHGSSTPTDNAMTLQNDTEARYEWGATELADLGPGDYQYWIVITFSGGKRLCKGPRNFRIVADPCP